MITKKLFGKLDGVEVYSYTLENKNGMSVKILDRGGVINQINAPDKEGRFTDVVGGYDNINYYAEASGYQGALIGRFGNRIAGGKFTLDGKEYTLFCNNNVINHLHGGKEGFDKKELFKAMQLFALDFDDGTPYSVIRNRAKEYGLPICFSYHTFSSTEDKPKFRIIFLTPFF